MTRDNLNQLGKGLRGNRKRSTQALNRDRPINPQLERVRDTMDFMVPFEMEFDNQIENRRILLNLTFLPPPKTGCCANCECSICEFFDGGITETEYQLTYAYVAGTVHVFRLTGGEITFMNETDPSRGLITVWAHNDDKIVVCYVYDVCLEGE